MDINHSTKTKLKFYMSFPSQNNKLSNKLVYYACFFENSSQYYFKILQYTYISLLHYLCFQQI
jgi:hypothetical protein